MSPRRRGRGKCRSGKTRYWTYGEAVIALSEREPGAVYICPRCLGWHTTRRVLWKKRRGGGKARRGSIRRPS
jgi:hypothetical protein